MQTSLLWVYVPFIIIIAIAWAVVLGIKRAAKKYPPAAPEISRTAGVGGWLLWLVLGLPFLGPLVGFGHISSDFASAERQLSALKALDAWGVYKAATWLTFAIICCISIYAGLDLIKGRDRTVVRRTQVMLWLIGPVASVVLGIMVPLATLGKSYAGSEFVSSLIASIVAAGIWTLYLAKSKRVKATYGTAVSSS